ncbi:MAG: hypothetical protein QOF25_1602 [Mycobacterium sp.]|jgi:hypothetical protein|nr:hypothetical protein [Mycobacterium sp.]
MSMRTDSVRGLDRWSPRYRGNAAPPEVMPLDALAPLGLTGAATAALVDVLRRLRHRPTSYSCRESS